MEYEWNIESAEFWEKMIHKVNEFYEYEPLHIGKMPKLVKDYMGLEYVETFIAPKHNFDVYFFKFKIINKYKFLLIKIDYGL